ncbi:hypothetical protein CVT24_005433 [Panaeolus cyanescens]|uniref:Uncharacterized protein n=1 Tax=Panaeolus cyanescens TaxID=181874 RepID=A0A409XAU4_9AGAR|nr:hypothetical protein CVT24_005433 [Panaeolus cyanescens]
MSTIVATFAVREAVPLVEIHSELKVQMVGVRDNYDAPVVGTFYMSRSRLHGIIRNLKVNDLLIVSSSFHVPFNVPGLSMGVVGEHFYGVPHWIIPIPFPDVHLTFQPVLYISGRVVAARSAQRLCQVRVIPKLCHEDLAVNDLTSSGRTHSYFVCKYPPPARPLLPSDDKMADQGDCISLQGCLKKVCMNPNSRKSVKLFTVDIMSFSTAEVAIPPGFEMVFDGDDNAAGQGSD